MTTDISAPEYHEQTKHSPQSVRSDPGLNFDNKPRPFKIYENLGQISLEDDIPQPARPALQSVLPEQPVGRHDNGSVDKTTVAGLCYWSAGITKTLQQGPHDRHFRAAACTGALYHINLYVVCGDLEDLDAGVYHFDPRANALDVLRKGEYRGVLADATHSHAIEHAPVSIVTTSTWWRNAWKYRARTYRHAFWDSGTVLANLLATATALDHPASLILSFADDAIADVIAVDPEWEAPLELVAIGSGHPAPDSQSVSTIDPVTRPLASDPLEYSLIYQAWNGSTLPTGDAAQEWRNQVDRSIHGGCQESCNSVPLDPVDSETASSRPLHATIQRRGSCREYVRESMSFRKFSTILDRALGTVPLDCLPDDEDGLENDGGLSFNECYCIINSVEDLEPGAYFYHTATNELERLHKGIHRQEAGHLALDQRLAADAVACLYFLADLEAVTDVLGDRGYRVAQLEAAIAGGRLYLATYAHRNVGGTGLTFYDDVVTDLFEPHATGQTPMFLYTIGIPA
jgi:SagB-type dehydrogenase family enzyme